MSSRKHNEWLRSELETLRRLWPSAPKERIWAALPRHTHASIEKTASTLKIGRRLVQRTGGGVLEALWRERERRRLTRRQVQEFCGFHSVMLGRWERGDAMPSLHNLEIWCAALEVELTLIPRKKTKIAAVGADETERLIP